jgi:ABC-type multidrug transport system ATPase subunit
MFDPSVPQADIERAAQMACIHDDIMKMPLGYDTPLTAAGSSLSGGQRQRIALARALLRSPRVLLLDEATSALDNLTEKQVMANLRQSGATIFVVAHRLTTVRAATFILVMDDGALVEGGSHEQLLRMNGLYAELVRAQDPLAAPAPGKATAQNPPQARRPMPAQAQRPAMRAQQLREDLQTKPQGRPQRGQGQVFELPKAPAQISNDDADPTVRRSAFSRPSIANDVSDDDVAALMRGSNEHPEYDRSGERVVPRGENVIALAARRVVGGGR